MESGYHVSGKVTGYENMFVRVGGTWTWLDYPIVEFIDRNNETRNGFIKYAKSGGRYFSIGQIVDIVAYDNTIYYKGTLRNSMEIYFAIVFITVGIGLLIYKNLN